MHTDAPNLESVFFRVIRVQPLPAIISHRRSALCLTLAPPLPCSPAYCSSSQPLPVIRSSRPGPRSNGTPPLPPSLSKSPKAAGWSRGRLERVADAAAQGAPLADDRERALVEALRSVVEPRRLASAKQWRSSRVSRRRRNMAWLRLQAACPPDVVKSLLQRVADRQGAR